MKYVLNFNAFLMENEDDLIFTTSGNLTPGNLPSIDKTSDDEHQEDEHGQDHEVGMAQNLLDDIIKNATELKQKIGNDEMNLPGWIQDHISQSQNYINQANTGYHELSEE